MSFRRLIRAAVTGSLNEFAHLHKQRVHHIRHATHVSHTSHAAAATFFVSLRVLVGASWPTTLITKLTINLRVNIYALVAIRAVREELASVARLLF